MRKMNVGKHEQELPNARKIRRSCNKELYRTIKRMKIYIEPALVEEAERRYYYKVVSNFIWITENGSNRKVLANWWAEHVAPDIAELWKVDLNRLSVAFRDGFGG